MTLDIFVRLAFGAVVDLPVFEAFDAAIRSNPSELDYFELIQLEAFFGRPTRDPLGSWRRVPTFITSGPKSKDTCWYRPRLFIDLFQRVAALAGVGTYAHSAEADVQLSVAPHLMICP
jgi:hypothetical protein